MKKMRLKFAPPVCGEIIDRTTERLSERNTDEKHGQMAENAMDI